jgi:hypothetical protein
VLPSHQLPIAPEQQATYAAALSALSNAGIDFLVGGGFGLAHYLPFWRSTKDLDIFIRPTTLHAALAALERDGFIPELTDPTWIAKARRDPAVLDLIFCSYNGLFRVDDTWFSRARDAVLLGVPVKVVAPEEMILSKSFVAARDRFDGADVSWLIKNHGHDLDWDRIECSMEGHWQVLLWQLQHCLYVFPSTRRTIPAPLIGRLLERFARELVSPNQVDARACRGPMLDPKMYAPAIGVHGAADPRPRVDLVSHLAVPSFDGDDDARSPAQVTSSLTSSSASIAPATSSGLEPLSSTPREK